MTSILRQAGKKINVNGTDEMRIAQPTARIETITPEVAAQMLKGQAKNRRLNKRQVAQYARDIENGDWRLNGQTVVFDNNNQLIEGQHRLHAVILAGKPIETFVVRGISDPKSFMTIDQHVRKSVTHFLEMEGYKNAKDLASITAKIMVFEQIPTFAELSRFEMPTAEQVLDRVKFDPELMASVEVGIRKSLRVLAITARTVGTLHYFFSQVDAEDADAFFEQLDKGSGLSEYDPILTLRNSLLRLKSQTNNTRINQLYVAAITIKAWNAWRAGEPVRLLRYRPGGANPEKFPEIR